MKKISVCVPTYNRPDTLLQLITSFNRQDYPNKELVLSDDSPSDVIKNLVEELNNNDIRYFHNLPGLGFSSNLRKTIERAKGNYIILLGDDDILLDSSALSSYITAFDKNPTVNFIYSNMVQFDNDMKVESVITFASKDRLFKKGKSAMENIWIRSIFIGGIGIRNIDNITKFYPLKKILHPQVEFIGNIINEADAYLLAKQNIGFRSHNDQIIFRALKNKKIRQEGNHMTVELFEIFTFLKKKYNLSMNFDFAAKELVNQQVVMMFKEKSNLGIHAMQNNYRKFCELSSFAKNSTKLKIGYLSALILPSFSITFLRKMVIAILRMKNKSQYKKYERKIQTMIAPVSESTK